MKLLSVYKKTKNNIIKLINKDSLKTILIFNVNYLNWLVNKLYLRLSQNKIVFPVLNGVE